MRSYCDKVYRSRMKAILIKIHPIWKSNFLSLGIGQSSEQYFGQLSQKALIKTLISLKHKMNVPSFVPSFLPLQHEKQSSWFCFSSQIAFICNSKNLLGFCDYFSVEEKPSQQTILPGPCSQTSDNILIETHHQRIAEAGRDLWRSSAFSKQDKLEQVSQGCVQSGFEGLQGQTPKPP